jgi:hypothetical protein
MTLDMTQFKQHLQDTNNSIYRRQKSLDEVSAAQMGAMSGMTKPKGKKQREEEEEEVQNENTRSDVELLILDYVDSFHGGLEEITENHVYEAIKSLNEQTAAIIEYLETGNEDLEENLNEFITSYFGDELNENTSDEDIMGAVEDLAEMCDSFNEYLKVQ